MEMRFQRYPEMRRLNFAKNRKRRDKNRERAKGKKVYRFFN